MGTGVRRSLRWHGSRDGFLPDVSRNNVVLSSLDPATVPTVTVTVTISEGNCLVKAICQADNRSTEADWRCLGIASCVPMSGGGMNAGAQGQSRAAAALSLSMNKAGSTVTCTHRNLVSNVTVVEAVECSSSSSREYCV